MCCHLHRPVYSCSFAILQYPCPYRKIRIRHVRTLLFCLLPFCPLVPQYYCSISKRVRTFRPRSSPSSYPFFLFCPPHQQLVIRLLWSHQAACLILSRRLHLMYINRNHLCNIHSPSACTPLTFVSTYTQLYTYQNINQTDLEWLLPKTVSHILHTRSTL